MISEDKISIDALEEIVENDPSGVLKMIQQLNGLLASVEDWEHPGKHQARTYLFTARHSLVCFWEFMGCPNSKE